MPAVKRESPCATSTPVPPVHSGTAPPHSFLPLQQSTNLANYVPGCRQGAQLGTACSCLVPPGLPCWLGSRHEKGAPTCHHHFPNGPQLLKWCLSNSWAVPSTGSAGDSGSCKWALPSCAQRCNEEGFCPVHCG